MVCGAIVLLAGQLITTGAAVAQRKQPSKAATSKAWADVPSMTNAGGMTERSVLSAGCTLLTAGPPRRVKCNFAQAMLRPPPSAQDLLEEERGMEQMLSSAARRKSFIAEVCRKKALADVEPDAFKAKLTDACARKSTAELKKAFAWLRDNVTAKTCEMWAVHYEEEFEQANADTWVGTTPGTCGPVTKTLWRHAGDSFWNYKQVRSITPNAGKACQSASQTPTEWRWNARQRHTLACTQIRR